MARPKIQIKTDPIDKFIEAFGVLGLLTLICLPIYFFDSLPDIIPRHFGMDGQPDGYSGKNIIWMFPAIGFILYVGMFWINKYPHRFNYPQEITEKNAGFLYKKATKMMRYLNVIIIWIFVYSTYATIQTALGNQDGLGSFFLPIFMVIIFGTTIYFLYTSQKKG